MSVDEVIALVSIFLLALVIALPGLVLLSYFFLKKRETARSILYDILSNVWAGIVGGYVGATAAGQIQNVPIAILYAIAGTITITGIGVAVVWFFHKDNVPVMKKLGKNNKARSFQAKNSVQKRKSS